MMSISVLCQLAEQTELFIQELEGTRRMLHLLLAAPLTSEENVRLEVEEFLLMVAYRLGGLACPERGRLLHRLANVPDDLSAVAGKDALLLELERVIALTLEQWRRLGTMEHEVRRAFVSCGDHFLRGQIASGTGTAEHQAQYDTGC
jgi:hypothetical protein